MKYIVIVFGVFFLLWILYSLRAGGVEQLSYEVISLRDGYEIRRYSPYIVAEVQVKAQSQREALYAGFSPLAAYIFGNNTANEKVAMTAPVMSKESTSKEIAMTAPVLSQLTEDAMYSVQFTMPKKYSISDLPKPNDANVTLSEIRARTVAALTYYGYYSASRMQSKAEELLTLLARDNVITTGAPQIAGYNDPFTFPLLIKNEILIDISIDE